MQSTQLFTEEGYNRADSLLSGPATVEFLDADGRTVVSSLELVLVEGPESVTRIPME